MVEKRIRVVRGESAGAEHAEVPQKPPQSGRHRSPGVLARSGGGKLLGRPELVRGLEADPDEGRCLVGVAVRLVALTRSAALGGKREIVADLASNFKARLVALQSLLPLGVPLRVGVHDEDPIKQDKDRPPVVERDVRRHVVAAHHILRNAQCRLAVLPMENDTPRHHLGDDARIPTYLALFVVIVTALTLAAVTIVDGARSRGKKADDAATAAPLLVVPDSGPAGAPSGTRPADAGSEAAAAAAAAAALPPMREAAADDGAATPSRQQHRQQQR
jgi:hypothetical protein